MLKDDVPQWSGRRDFLIKSGWLAVGVTMLSSCSSVGSIIPAIPSTADPELEDAVSWIQVLPGGKIRFFCPRMEMGQGTQLGLTQIVAEELNVDPPDIECVTPDTSQTPPFKMTVGSEGIASFFDPVSYGAAWMREVLRHMAAEKSGLPVAQVIGGHGGFILPDGTTIKYGALIGVSKLVLDAGDLSVSGKAVIRNSLKPKGRHQVIGRNWKHHDLNAIVTGKAVYSRDVSVPDMLYGQILRPPAFGSKLISVDDRKASTMAGVKTVVIDKRENFIGLVADNPFVLSRAANAIDARWQTQDGLTLDEIDTRLDVAAARERDDFEHTLISTGDLDSGQRQASQNISASYETSFATHAPIEPRSSVVWVKEDGVEVWCGTQDPYFVQQRVAKILSRPREHVVVYPHRVGGGFGGRVLCQASEEAARLSAAVGQPVRVQWDRKAEFQNSYLQPKFSHFINAGTADDGTISHWEHDFVSSPIITGFVPDPIAWVMDRVMADKGTARGALSHYQVKNKRVRYSDIRTEVPIGAWRGLGAAPNTFAIESMMDELAAANKIDPIDFRLRNLPKTGSRLAAVLQRVAEISSWGNPARVGTGRGVACAVYKEQTAAAVVADVEIDKTSGEVRILKVWCAQDCGLVINPDQVENQIIGNIVWGCSMALKEKITIEGGAVMESNFDGYEVLRHHETPEMVVDLVVPPDAPPVAVGESAFAPVAPAIANAVFAASGRRVRSLPMSYEDIYPNSSG